MPTFKPQEVHIPIDGQTDLKLNHPYELGVNELMVYLNGMLVIKGEDYEEHDNLTIRFKYQLSSMDIVVTQHQVYFTDKLVQVIADKGSALFQKYGEKERLLLNQRYDWSFKYKDQSYSSMFYTKINPLFSTLNIIAGDLGDIVSGFKEPAMLLQIYQNSVLALNIAGDTQLAEITTAMESKKQVPYYVRQYVRYQTELDMLLSIYLSLSSQSGVTKKKTLGALSFDTSSRFVAFENVEPLLGEIKAKSASWEAVLRGLSVATPTLIASAVKGGADSYPLTSPRRTFGEEEDA